MENIIINIAGRDYTFAVKTVCDSDHGAPWEEEDGHGPVSDWERRDKLPGELILNEDRGMKRFYDFAEACRIARRDSWGTGVRDDVEGMTRRQVAALAARRNFDYLKAWCNDEWHYVGVIVTLLDEDGEETDIDASLWGVEDSDDDYIREEARRLADDLARGHGTQWDYVATTTARWLKK